LTAGVPNHLIIGSGINGLTAVVRRTGAARSSARVWTIRRITAVLPCCCTRRTRVLGDGAHTIFIDDRDPFAQGFQVL